MATKEDNKLQQAAGENTGGTAAGTAPTTGAPAAQATNALAIKQEHLKKVVGFNNSGAPLGERSQEDLEDLAITALQSGNRNLLALFANELPEVDTLLERQADRKLAKASKRQAVAMPGMQGAGANPNPVTTPAAQ